MLYNNTRIGNNKINPKEINQEDTNNRMDHKDEKLVNKILETNNQIRKKLPQV